MQYALERNDHEGENRNEQLYKKPERIDRNAEKLMYKTHAGIVAWERIGYFRIEATISRSSPIIRARANKKTEFNSVFLPAGAASWTLLEPELGSMVDIFIYQI